MHTSARRAPNTQSVTASNKNWMRMKVFLAPMAFWTPMILVRSRTETNMMFAMLKHPTRMANMAMNHPPFSKLSKTPSRSVATKSMWFTAKSFSLPGRTRRTDLKCWMSSLLRASMSTPGRALMEICVPSSPPTSKIRGAKVEGTIMDSSNPLETRLWPCSTNTPTTSNLVPRTLRVWPKQSVLPNNCIAT